MVYTCAYYRDPDGKLEQAQRDKLDLVCRKLELQPGETLLDVGCGWGSLSIWAAQHYGVRAHGVTLSQAQAAYAAERIRKEGLEDRCRVEHLDYRDLPASARYQKIAAVGVIEHVGIPNYPAFFGGVRARLEDGGLYLNHGIVHEFHWTRTSQTEFLYRHVFPNGDLAGLSQTLTEIERAGFCTRGRHEAPRDRRRDRGRPRGRRPGSAQAGADEAGRRDALGAVRDPGAGLVRSGRGHRGLPHAVLGALRPARRAGEADAGQSHDAEPGGVVDGERGSACLRVQAARGPEVPQRRSLHRRRREVQLPAVQGRQSAQGPGEGDRGGRRLPRAPPTPRAFPP